MAGKLCLQDRDFHFDIYMCGTILYEMLTGKVPFEGETPISVAVKHLTVSPQQPIEINKDIPPNINHIIMKCMEKDRTKRYKNSQELLEEIGILCYKKGAQPLILSATDEYSKRVYKEIPEDVWTRD